MNTRYCYSPSPRDPSVRELESAYKSISRLMSLDIFISSDSYPLFLTFHTLTNMSIGFKIWLFIIDLLIFTLLGVFIVVYGIVALSLPDTKTAGILTLIVDISLSSTVLVSADKS